MTQNEFTRRENAVSYAFKDKDIDKALKYMKEIIKYNRQRLVFRFRPPEEREINTLRDKKIYLNRPSRYKDNEDCEVLFNIPELLEYLMIKKKPDKYSKFCGLVDSQFEQEIKDNLEKNSRFIELQNRIRDKVLVACLSGNYSEYMWEEYAHNSEGICLVYDIYDIILLRNEIKVYPVRYVENRRQCKDIKFGIAEYGDSADCFENERLKFILSCLTKNRYPYFQEAEWRLFGDNTITEKEKGKLFSFPVKPKIIILGKNISRNNEFETKIRDYAREEGIELINQECFPLNISKTFRD